MKQKIHIIAGVVGFLTILAFWTSTVLAELFGRPETIAQVKSAILMGMVILIPSMVIVGGSGMAMGARRKDAPALAKKKRMPIIAANGLILLLPAAVFLEGRASEGLFDMTFYIIQVVELIAGAVNLTLMGMNIKSGREMANRRKGDACSG